MKRSLIISSGVLLLVFSVALIAPVQADTTWGFEIDKDYIFELKQLSFYGNDLTLLMKPNTTFRVVFTESNDTGYVYDSYDIQGYMGENSTNFVPTLLPDNVTIFPLPQGLPVALPLTLGAIPDYLDAFGQLVNQSASMLVIDELFPNITDYILITYMEIYSLYTSEYLSANLDLYAPTVNASVLSEMLTGIDTGGVPLTIPANITDFKLNATIAFDATTGLFDYFKIRIRSLAEEYGYVDNFNVDVRYGLYVPPPPITTTPPPTTAVSFAWLIPGVVTLTILSGLFYRRKRK